MGIKKWYYLKGVLDFSTLKEEQLTKQPSQEAIDKYQAEMKNWEESGKEGQKPDAPKGEMMGSNEVISMVLQSVLNAKYQKTDLNTLKKIRNIRTGLNKDVTEKAEWLKLGDKDYKLMVHAWETFEEWPASVLNQELLPQIDEILRNAEVQETLKNV
jgi:hypothetical protein